MNGTPACRVYLIRHGETVNAGDVCFNGHFDVGLSSRGEHQIRQVADALEKVPLSMVYSSDLERTRSGARMVGEFHGIQPVYYPDLRELSFGIWEGLSVREVNEKYPNLLEDRLKNIEAFCVEGGETFLQLEQRVIPKFEEIVKRHCKDCIAIISHGGVNRIILAHLLNIPIRHLFRLNQEYAAVNIIQFYDDNNVVVELVGGTHHDIQPPRHIPKKINIQ